MKRRRRKMNAERRKCQRTWTGHRKRRNMTVINPRPNKAALSEAAAHMTNSQQLYDLQINLNSVHTIRAGIVFFPNSRHAPLTVLTQATVYNPTNTLSFQIADSKLFYTITQNYIT